ncbi:hypothetical protein YC2023_065994 [Brassica napus]
MLALPVDCSGDFGPRGLSVQYTQDVCVCPYAHTGHPRVSVSTHKTFVAVRQHTQDVRGCPCVSVSTHRTSVAGIGTHISTLVLGLSTLALPVDCLGDFGPCGLSVQYTQDVRGCPPAHTGCPWLSVAVRGCPSAQTGCPWLSVCVGVCPSAHIGRMWLSISTHISTLVLGLSTQALPVDCSGDFGPRGLSVQYTQDVRGCPSAHTGRPCVSVSTQKKSVAVRVCPSAYTRRPWLSISTHISTLVLGLSTLILPMDCLGDFGPRGLYVQYTQDVRGCPPAHKGRPWLTHKTSVAVHQYTNQHAGPWTQHAGPSRGLFGTQRTSVAVHVCPSAHTERQWLSISTHISTLVLGLSTLTLPVDCSSDFGPRGLSVQYVQDVRGCPPVHTGRPWVSASTHRTSMAVCGYRPFPWTVRVIFGPRGLSVQYTQDVHGCPSADTGRSRVSVSTHRTSVAFHVCPSAYTGRPWLSISTHISTLVLGLSTLALPVDCLGDFGPCGLSVQYTQDVRGCPPAHTERPWLSVSTHRMSVAIRLCPCVSISTHRTSVAVHQYTYQHAGHWIQHAGPSRGLFGTSVCVCQHTQDVSGSPCVSVSIHRTSVAVHQYTYQHIGPWTQHADPSRGLFGMSVAVHRYTYQHVGPWTQHAGPSRGLFGRFWPTWAVCSVHTGRLWVSAITHRPSVGVHQHTQDVCGCPSAHTGCPWLSVCIRVCPSAHTGRPWLSFSTHISTLVLGLSTLVLGLSVLALPVDCSGDFGPHGLSVQYTQDVRGCPSAHTGRPCVSVSTHKTSVAVHHTHRTSVGVSQHTQDVLGCLWLSVSTHRMSVAVRVCPCVSVSTHRTSVAVHQYTYRHAGPWTQHAAPSRGLFGLFWPTWAVCSVHTGRPWVSARTHRMTVAVSVCPTLAHPVDSSGDFGPRGLSVQYTQDVRVCLSAHTRRLCVSVSTHKTSVAVRQHTQDVCRCPCVSVSTHRTSVAVHQYTYQHDAHTRHPWLSVNTHRTSVAVLVCPSAHTGRLWLSISTNISTLVLGLSTLALLVDCLGDFGPRGLSVQYTQDVRGCPPAHTGLPWLSVAVRPWLSVSTHRMSVAIRLCPCVSISTHRTSVAVHQYTYQHAGHWTQHAGPSRGLFGTSVAVRVCLSEYTGRLWLSISTHISTLVLGLSTLALPVDCPGDFGPGGLSVQYTRAVRGCPPAHTRRLLLSVAVHQYTYQLAGPWTQHAGPSRGLFGLIWPMWAVCLVHTGRPCVSVSTHKTSVCVRQHTQDFRGCPSTHTGRPWLSICVRQHTHDVRGCPSTQDVRGCPPAHTGHPWVSASTHRTSVAVRQHTQDVCGYSTLALPVDCSGDFGPRGLSVQYTQDVRVCPSAHTGRPCVSVSTHKTDVRGCPSAHTGRPYLSIGTHMSTLVLEPSTLALRVDCMGDFGPCGLFVQYTQDVRGCPPAHTGRPWLSVSTHRMSVAIRLCPCVSINTHKTYVAVHQYTYQHAGHWSQHAGPSRGLFGIHRTSVAVHQYTYQHVGPWIQHADPSRGLFGTSVGVRQHTQDVRVCPSAHTTRLWLSVNTHRTFVAVRVCPSAHIGRPWLSIGTHISTVVLGLSTLGLPVDYLGDFSPRGLSVQYTQDVRGCPPAHTGHPWVLVNLMFGSDGQEEYLDQPDPCDGSEPRVIQK